MKRTKLFFSVIIILTISVNSFAQSWDGSSAVIWTQGDGISPETAYEIATPDNLAYLAQQVNGGSTYENTYFKMTADLDLGSFPWTRIGGAKNDLTGAFPFKGIFDGNGHCVSNLFINRTGNNTTNDAVYGLFGYVNGGLIKNLGIESGSVLGFNSIGGLIGILNTGTVENCYNKASVETARASGNFGGVVGVMKDGTIRYCYNAGNLMEIRGTLNNQIGGVVGIADAGTIEYCFNVAFISGNNQVGGIVGSGGAATIHNCYNTGKIKGKQNFGGIVGSVLNDIVPEIEKCYSVGIFDIADVIGSYGAIMGAVNSRPVNNSFYDTQLITSSSVGKGMARLSSQLIGDGVRSYLGDDNWIYTEGLYPALKNFNTSDAAVLSVAPFVLDVDDDINNVISNFTVETSTGVSWNSSDAGVINISGNNASVYRKPTDEIVDLTATYGTESKTYKLTVLLDVTSDVVEFNSNLKVVQLGNMLAIRDKLLRGGRINIYNLAGTLVLTQGVDGVDKHAISLVNLQSGVYIVSVLGNDGVIFKDKLFIP